MEQELCRVFATAASAGRCEAPGEDRQINVVSSPISLPATVPQNTEPAPRPTNCELMHQRKLLQYSNIGSLTHGITDAINDHDR